jgi:ankyrin repeat protein
MTLLHWAADRGFPVIAQHILRVGPSLINIQVPRKKKKDKKVPDIVLCVVRLGFSQAHCQKKLQLNFHFFQDADGQTPLHYACNCEHVSVVRILLESGADTSILDSDGNTPLTVGKLLNICNSGFS